jgi:betaine-aldehyde dehydrogenase
MTSVDLKHFELFVAGEWVAGEGSPLAVVDPSSETELCSVHTATGQQVDAAVRRAAYVQRELRRTSGAQRAQWLRQIAGSLAQAKERFATIECLNVGKPYAEALLDVEDTIACFEFYADQAQELDARQEELIATPAPDFEVRVRYEPVGVSALIIPWNFPLLTTTWKLAPALAAGCASIVKPSEYTPLSALALAEVISTSGVPAGAVSILNGRGPTVGELICRHSGVTKISFTGSTQTGRRVAAIAAQDYKRVTLEGGGKSPIIVFADSPVDFAVQWILYGALYNQGEVCNSTSRVLIEAPIHAEVVDRLCAQMRALRVGPPSAASTQMGPLQNRAQLDKFLRYVDFGRAQGGRLKCGGHRHPQFTNGYYVEPTLFDDVPIESAIWREEIFGPLLAVRSFAAEEEVIAIANDNEFGLAAAVLSADTERAARVTRALDAGCVWTNCSGPAFVQGPWGGFKRSGVGRELGRWGLDAFLEVKQMTRYGSSATWTWYRQ